MNISESDISNAVDSRVRRNASNCHPDAVLDCDILYKNIFSAIGSEILLAAWFGNDSIVKIMNCQVVDVNTSAVRINAISV